MKNKEFNLSEWIVNAEDVVPKIPVIKKIDVKEFIKRRESLDRELWVLIMGNVDIEKKLDLQEFFDKHKVERDKLAGEKLI